MEPTPEGASCQAANVERVLAKLQGVKLAGNGKWVARCPAHEDKHASLSIRVGRDGRMLLKCFAGCLYPAIRDALGLTDRDLGPQKSRTRTCPPKTGATVQHPSPRSITTPSRGCTLAGYAEAKRLPAEFLQALGISDCVHEGSRAIRIPYYGSEGAVSAVRFRLALRKSGGDDNRFRWRSRAKPSLYGLSRLA